MKRRGMTYLGMVLKLLLLNCWMRRRKEKRWRTAVLIFVLVHAHSLRWEEGAVVIAEVALRGGRLGGADSCLRGKCELGNWELELAPSEMDSTPAGQMCTHGGPMTEVKLSIAICMSLDTLSE